MGGFADTLAATTPRPAPTTYPTGSTDKQDLAVQWASLEGLGVALDCIYTHHGLSGPNRARPGLGQALPPCGPGTRW